MTSKYAYFLATLLFPILASDLAAQSTKLKDTINLRTVLIPEGSPNRPPGRKLESPRYVTIHSTHVFTKGRDAAFFANSLSKAWSKSPLSRTGFTTWHFTVDQEFAVQHLPLDEQGDHSDGDGPGNRSSIAIEMCENEGNDRMKTIDRAARLAAWICITEKIPVTNIKMHWHWPRTNKEGKKYSKTCPHFFFNDQKPNQQWTTFLQLVEKYAKQP